MLARIAGRGNINFLKSWATTGAFFGSAAGLTFLYMTDWKAVLQYVPVYNTKFKTED